MKSLKRSEVEEKYTWNLSDLCDSPEEFYSGLDAVEKRIYELRDKYLGKLNSVDIIDEMITDMEDLNQEFIRIYGYANLNINVERGNPQYQEMISKASNVHALMDKELTFTHTSLIELDEETLNKVVEKNPRNRGVVHDVLRAKKEYLGKDIEETLSSLSKVFDNPFSTYSIAKHADLAFEPFEVDGKEYPLSLVLFENYYEGLHDTGVRRAAFDSFSRQLRKYQNTFASAYEGKLNMEKALANLRGYDSVIDYLLYKQEVSRELYDRQIDIIMDKFAPVVRKYVGLIKRVNKLDKLTYADLKIPLDPNHAEEVTIEEAKDKLITGLKVLGPEYVEIIRKAFDERWIDFPVNDGKTNGAFCFSPYGVHSYILNSWTGSLEDLFILGHELGHAGHFHYAQKHNSISNTRASMYFIEAPSTTNELILANDMLSWSDQPEFQRFVYSTMISRTYYHNMVTHLLEAHYQREVYKRIDKGEGINAHVLNQLFMNTLKEFWGDSVELIEGAELTWMRQSHYYSGLYPYTYSAGLTIGTQVAQRIVKEGDKAVEDWLNTLSAGGTKDSIGLAKMAGVDITTDKPLLDTIQYLSDIVDKIEEITNQLGQ